MTEIPLINNTLNNNPAIALKPTKDIPVDKIDAASKDFEALFLSEMLKGMFSGEELTEFAGGGNIGEIYKSLLVTEYGKAIASSGGIGIAKQIKQELLKLQETK
jgi:peptidoglycan hydrolase FlgJ